MQLHLEQSEKFSIQSYENNAIKINNILYNKSLIVSAKKIIDNWSITNLNQIKSINNLKILTELNPEVIIIGHSGKSYLPNELIAKLNSLKIGIEVMTIGSAARTFNILLSEYRQAVLGLILN